MDASRAIDLVDLATARIFLAKLEASSTKPDPPVLYNSPTPTKTHRQKGDGVWAYLSKNAKSYPRLKSLKWD
ncbi:hypothetical protein M0R72_17080 [Candidatus Pacearchaeota archaeon]|jgi:hypothetical protein|nr:hypothetical protein [Candidatus Pacearchaeota archaeon]